MTRASVPSRTSFPTKSPSVPAWMRYCGSTHAVQTPGSAHEQPPYPRGRVEVPTAFARFPGEPWTPARSAVERAYNLVRWSELERGGHFAALEQPQPFAEDVAAFFAQLS